MSRKKTLALALFALSLLTIATGCRNRCYNTCGGGLFAGSPTIAAPPTYSLNIPSVAQQQPYYVPGNNRTALNPYAAAPTSATNNNQSGWNPATPNNSGATNSGSTNGNSRSTGQSVLTNSPTTFVETSPSQPNNNPTQFRLAANTALPGSGMSFTDSTNYRTTRVDETQDQSRLPATDASAVRAPAQNYPTGNVNQPRFAAAPVFPNTYNASVSQTYSVGQPPNLGQPFYLGTPMVGNSRPAYLGQPMTVPRYSSPTVVAQSTTTFDAGSGGGLGWRDRELGSRRE